MRDANAPNCQSCETAMAPALVSGALIGWFCIPCSRFRPEMSSMTFNNHVANKKEV